MYADRIVGRRAQGGRGTWRFAVAAAFALAWLTPRPGAADPPPDFAGELRPGLPIQAWFSADRRRGFFRVRATTSKVYPAYAVALADLDADGTREVLVGIWSSTRRHVEPEPHRTVWVLAWSASRRELVEVWRGSALARPLLAFTTRDDHLVTTERDGERCLETTYDWTGFGFVARTSTPTACGGP